MEPNESAGDASSKSAVLKTLLLTDLVGSTKLLEAVGDQRAFEIFGRHDRIARDLLGRYGGLEIDKTDGFLLLFERPLDAVAYSLAYHQALAELSREEGVTLSARAGIHLGEVWVRENSPEDVARGAKPLEVEGLAKPVAARLMSLAQGQQTLLTRGAYDLGRRAAVGFDFEDHVPIWAYVGRYGFKGVDEPIRVFEVTAEALPSPGPPPDSAKAWRVTRSGAPVAQARKRLPIIAGGAAALVLAVITAIVMLTGGDMSDNRRTIAVLGFNNVKGNPEAAWLSTALVETLNADLAGGGELRTVPGESIARARQDLGLDNLQTLADDTLALLRRRLGADYFVAGGYLRAAGTGAINLNLWAQDAGSGNQAATLTQQGTEDELFQLVAAVGASLREQLGATVDQAQSANLAASFPTSASGAKLYAEGLEALRASNPQRAADLLERAAALEPDSPLVHLALANAWRSLGYGGRSREAATRAWEVAAASEDLPREQRLHVEARYAETLGKWDAAVEGYATLFDFDPHNLLYGIRLAAAQIPAGDGEGALQTLALLRELPEPMGSDPFIDYYEARAARSLSRYDEQLDAAGRTIEKARALQSPELEGRAFIVKGQAETKLGDADEATRSYMEARRLFELSGNRKLLAQCLNLLATTFLAQGDQDGAKQLFTESLDASRRIGDRRGTASALGNLALISRREGDLDTAATSLEEVIVLFRETGNLAYEAVTLSNLADVKMDLGELAEAQSQYEQALEAFEKIGRKSSWANTLASMGDLELVRGSLTTARDHHERALAVREELGEARKVAESRVALSGVLTEIGDTTAAADQARQAAAYFAESSTSDGEAIARAALARALVKSGDIEAAVSESTRAEELVAESSNRGVQMKVWLARARAALAAGDDAGAMQALEAIREAQGSSLLATSHPNLEARMIAALIASREGRPSEAALSLEQVETEARDNGYGLAAAWAAEAHTRVTSGLGS